MTFPSSSEIATCCGQLIIGGFTGTSLPSSFASALRRGERGGAILFRRNFTGDVSQAAALNAAIVEASLPEYSPLIGVDQEGGRVARLGAPLLVLPPMRTLGALRDEDFLRRVAFAQARELATLGFTMNFAPVLDVHTRDENPVIGDRAFASDADTVARLGVAWALGLEDGGVLSCGKHFPGHGDTTHDSHFDLPVIEHDRARLDRVELVPFRRAARAKIAALMTAHVVVSAMDPNVPATLSRAVSTDLRDAIGFDGVLISDDLEMRAVADRYSIEDSAIMAIEAGCNALLVCSDESLQDRAHAALVRHAEKSPSFRGRCEEALRRVLVARRRMSSRPCTNALELSQRIGGEASRKIASEIAERLRGEP